MAEGSDTQTTDAEDAQTTPTDDVETLRKALARANEDAKRHRLRNKELEPLAVKARELEQAQKTAEQRLAERVETAERLARENKLALARYRVAVAKGVPAELVDRLRGDSEEELATDADALLALLAPTAPTTAPGPRPDMSQGARNEAALNGDPLLTDLKRKLGIP